MKNKKLNVSIVVIVLFIVVVWFLKMAVPGSNISRDAIVSSSTSGTLKYLTDASGRTLYTSTDDGALNSTCINQCLEQWPLFEAGDEDLSKATDPLSMQLQVVKRADGSSQYAYDSKPLYYYSGDKNPGDKNGDKLGRIWNIVVIP